MAGDLQELLTKVLDAGVAGYERRKIIEELTSLDADPDRIHDTLVALLADEDSYIQREAVKAIGKRMHARAAAELIRFLETKMGKDEYVNRDAVETLEKLGDPSAMSVLKNLSSASSFTLSYAARHAFEALEKIAPASRTEPPAIETPKTETAPEAPMLEPKTSPVPDASEQRVSAPPPPPTASTMEEDAPAKVPIYDSLPKPPAVDTSFPPPTTETSSSKPKDVPPLNWDRMPRLAAFFDDAWDEVKQWYAEKIQSERELVPLENEHLETMVAIERRRADKDDEIAACRKSIEGLATRIEAIENGIRRKKREYELHDATTEDFWWTIKAFFVPGLRSELKADLERLKEEITEDKRLRKETQAKRTALLKELTDLTDPLDDLMTQSKKLKKEMRTRRKSIVKMHGRITRRIFRIVCGTGDEELHRRLDPLARRHGADPFLRKCIDEIQDVALTLKGLNTKLKKHRKAVRQCGQQCTESADALGQAFRDGFSIDSSERKSTIKLLGRLRFLEESSFFGGYSNAEGSASGSGSATASYVVEETDWRPTPALGEAVNVYHETWETLGARLAGEALLQARRAVAQRTVSDYVAYLRSELERDLREDDHG